MVEKEIRTRCKRAAFEKYSNPEPGRYWTDEQIDHFFEERSIGFIASGKDVRSFSWLVNINNFLLVEQVGEYQHLRGLKKGGDLKATYLCVT